MARKVLFKTTAIGGRLLRQGVSWGITAVGRVGGQRVESH